MIKSIFYPLAVKDLQKFIPEVTYRDVKRSVFFCAYFIYLYTYIVK